MTFLLNLSGGAYAIGNSSITSEQIKSQLQNRSAEKILQGLRTREYAKKVNGEAVGCYVANIAFGLCKTAYYRAPSGGMPTQQICIERRIGAHFSVKSSIAASFLNATATSALRKSYNLAAASMSSITNPSIANRAKQLFLQDVNNNLCGSTTPQNIYQTLNFSQITVSQIGSDPTKDFQLYTTNLTPSGLICFSKLVSKPIFDENCNKQQKLVKLGQNFCKRLKRLYRTGNGPALTGQTVPAPINAVPANLLADIEVATALESPQVLAAYHDAMHMPALADLHVEPAIRPKFALLTNATEINNFIAADQANFGLLAAAVSAMKNDMVVRNLSVSELGADGPAFNAIVNHPLIKPVYDNRAEIFDQNEAILPKTEATLIANFNNFQAADVPPVIATHMWGLTAAELPIKWKRPKRFCRELAPVSFVGLSATLLNEIATATPQVLPPRPLNLDAVLATEIGASQEYAPIRTVISSAVPSITSATFEAAEATRSEPAQQQ
jgi:hypothetical protein